MTVVDRLRDYAIDVPRKLGEHRTACPQCASRDARAKDTALAVKVTADSAVWFCHRCNWTGRCNSEAARITRDDRTPDRVDLTDRMPYDRLSARGEWLWRQGKPITSGSCVGQYLQARKCCIPGEHACRELDSHWCNRDWSGACMVSLITHVTTNDKRSLHLTWVSKEGDGKKAPVDRPRQLLKQHKKANGVIRLSPDQDVMRGLFIGEGIETCLSIMHGVSPVWCCIDAGNLGAFPVLAGVECLTILVDNDDAGKRAADQCLERWGRAGREVRLITPHIPKTDVNDLARAAL